MVVIARIICRACLEHLSWEGMVHRSSLNFPDSDVRIWLGQSRDERLLTGTREGALSAQNKPSSGRALIGVRPIIGWLCAVGITVVGSVRLPTAFF